MTTRTTWDRSLALSKGKNNTLLMRWEIKKNWTLRQLLSHPYLVYINGGLSISMFEYWRVGSGSLLIREMWNDLEIERLFYCSIENTWSNQTPEFGRFCCREVHVQDKTEHLCAFDHQQLEWKLSGKFWQVTLMQWNPVAYKTPITPRPGSNSGHGWRLP